MPCKDPLKWRKKKYLVGLDPVCFPDIVNSVTSPVCIAVYFKKLNEHKVYQSFATLNYTIGILGVKSSAFN